MKLSWSEWGLVALVAVVFLAHLLIIRVPMQSYVFDEAYYVPAAQCFINGTPPGKACNLEHPPLAKALMAASMSVFGNNGLGWRLPSVIAGTLALAIVYFLTRRWTDEKTAFLATFLLGFETLWFIHSSVAMLDIIAIFFGLLGIYWFVSDQKVLAGIALGLAMLSKETLFLLLPILAVYAAIQNARLFSRDAVQAAWRFCKTTGIVAVIVLLAGLMLYNQATGAFPTPYHNIKQIVSHGKAIGVARLSEGVHPFQWFSGVYPWSYYVTTVSAGGKPIARPVQYYGQLNYVVFFLFWLALPYAWREARKKKPLELLHLLIIGISFAAFMALDVLRVTYYYYLLLFLPSICVLNARFLARFPKNVIITYCIGVVLWFVFWFPRNVLALSFG